DYYCYSTDSSGNHIS
nr:immunoglobulin light chain junction region [Macaca mulatta]